MTVTGTITDNDTAGVTLSKSTLTVTEQDTTGDTYTVVLDSQPTADVVVTVAGPVVDAGTDVTATSTPVVLDSEPTADVTVTVAGHAGTDVTATSTPLTFTTELEHGPGGDGHGRRR